MGKPDKSNPLTIKKYEIEKWESEGYIEYLGYRNDLNKIIPKAHIIVLPSYYPEGLPKVLLEAAACSCAVITTNHPGCRDAIIPNETGLLVKPRDIDSLKDSIISLLCDRDWIKSMGKSGRRLAEEKFSVKKVIDIHLDLYHFYKMDKN